MQQVFLRRLATAASLATAWLLGLTGCTSPQPSEQIAVSNASLGAARAAGAEVEASLLALLETVELGYPAKPGNPAKHSSGSPR